MIEKERIFIFLVFRFAVFALGSSAYPNFCAFGKYVDNLLLELGGERIMKLATGDEMCAQEQAFSKWAQEAFNVSDKTLCLKFKVKIFKTYRTLAGGVRSFLFRRRRHFFGRLGDIFLGFFKRKHGSPGGIYGGSFTSCLIQMPQ